MEMPPLMKLVIARNRAAKGETVTKEDLLLPAHKIYVNDVRLSETLESYKTSQFFHPEFYKQVEDFDMSLIPTEEWNRERMTSLVGHRTWPSYTEGDKFGYEELCKREEASREVE